MDAKIGILDELRSILTKKEKRDEGIHVFTTIQNWASEF